MTSPGGKLTVLACHPTKKGNKAEELTYLFVNIGQTLAAQQSVTKCIAMFLVNLVTPKAAAEHERLFNTPARRWICRT